VNAPELILRMSDYRLVPEPVPAADLLKRATAGDRVAFEQILIVHEKLVLGTALRMTGRMEDAQDAAQEVFLRLFRNLKKFRTTDELRPWLYRVTINVCHDLRRRNSRQPSSWPEGLDPSTASPSPESAFDTLQRRLRMEIALAGLPEKERAALVLREVEGLSTREVAEILNSSEATVRSQICSARIKLRAAMDRAERRRS